MNLFFLIRYNLILEVRDKINQKKKNQMIVMEGMTLCLILPNYTEKLYHFYNLENQFQKLYVD